MPRNLQVGATVRHGVRFLVSQLDGEERSACAHDGFQLLADGKEALVSLLEKLTRDSSARKTGDIGGRAIFGRLYEMLAHENDDPAYDPIREIMREVGLSNLALGPGDYLFGPVETRRIHSVHSAAKEFDIHPIRLKKMIVKAGFVEAEVANLPSDRILVDAGTMAAFVEKSKTLVSANDTRERLGASRTELRALVTAGYLQKNGGYRGRKGEHLPVMPKYAIEEIDDLLVRLSKAVASTVPKPDWVDLPTSRKRAECSLEEIFALIFSGNLEGVAQAPGFIGFSSVRLDAAELKEKTALADHGCLSIQQARSALPARDAVVKALIKNGHLLATQRRNPIKRHLQTVVEPSELDKFKAKFASLYEIARSRGTNPARALKLLAGIPPAFDPVEIGGGHYYKRTDVGL
ncbi:hypothetical protein [Rhizobium sp. BR 315]|uniref:hypothetical protein n=1 Tax=Rhizobium sp. BR 315 TaxID=3040014 RepID=UPI003D355A5C